MKVVLLFLALFFNIIQSIQANSRQPKFWPATVVRFRNDVCSSVEGYDGTCYTRYQCQQGGGQVSGSCANGIGDCCIFQATCGAITSDNNTYFINPQFPNTFSSSISCSLTIQKCNPDICQVRLDFLNFNLAQPDGNGNCVTDSFVVTGGASNLPVICGENSGEHMYVNFNGDNNIVLSISTSALLNFGRSWNIKVTQLACDCPSLAPTGCLMYYTALTGTVNSFNYGSTLSGAIITLPDGQTRPGTREMVNLNYGVCIQMQPGYCGIRWSQGPDSTSFTVSNDTAIAAVPPPGLPSNGLMGTNCATDFVVVPNPVYPNGTSVGTDRFCGNQFPTVISYSKPFVLTVVTNGNDTTDIANRGFSLNYEQVPCTGTAGILMMVARKR